jgi:tol-pal system protein YbgF
MGALRFVSMAGALALGFAAAVPVQAQGLFDDKEARKAIVDLRGVVAANEEATRGRIAALEGAQSQIVEQLAVIRRSLLDLNNQLEALRGEIAKLRGDHEQTGKDIAELQRRQQDVGVALDTRLRKLEPVKVALDGAEFMADPDEKRAYDEAIAIIRGGDFDKAVAAFGNFQRRYPGSPFTNSVRYWSANALYGKREYREAIAAYRAFVAAAPEHPRAAEALLALANSQAEMKDNRGARRTIEELMKTYPQSEAAAAGKERLATLPRG